MPLDPFFTSKVKDEFHEDREKKKAFAKACQFGMFAAKISKKKKAVFLRNTLEHDAQKIARRLYKGALTQITGGKSLSGFKSPVKIWTEIRKSGKLLVHKKKLDL